MTKLNCTITDSDDNNLILETRGRGQQTRVIPRDENAATALLSAIEAAITANQPPQRQAEKEAAKAKTAETSAG